MGYFTEYTLESLIDRYVILEQQLIFLQGATVRYSSCCLFPLGCGLWVVGPTRLLSRLLNSFIISNFHSTHTPGTFHSC